LELLADRQRVQGPDHPDTLSTRARLASLRWEAGDREEAVAAVEELLADRQRVQGPDHSDTLSTRARLASLLCWERHERDGSWWAWVSWIQQTSDCAVHKVVCVAAESLTPLETPDANRQVPRRIFGDEGRIRPWPGS
jgi:hypothetical protein